MSSFQNHIYMRMFCLTVGLILLANNAIAEGKSGLFIEPGLTYETSDTHVDYPSPLTSSTGKADGFGLGARLGFHLQEVFFLALDGRYSMPQFKDSSVNYDAKSIATNWGPVLGIQMPTLGLRVWGAYIVDGELNPEQSGSFDLKFTEAKGYRIGTGFRLLMFSINLEYQDLKYGKTTLEQLGPFSPGTSLNSVELENKTWLVSASFPIEM